MCFDIDSRPPIPPLAGAAVDGRRIELTSSDGTRFAAFKAEPTDPNGAAVLILPDARGLYRFYEELALRFAEAGVTALAIDYFGRTAQTAERGDDFDYQPHIGQVTWDGLHADAKAGRDELASSPGAGAIFSVGFCFGGRLSFLLGSQPDFDMSGVIGFYGWPVGEARGGVPAPIDQIDALSAPVLGLFGGADRGVTPDLVEQYRSSLETAGKPHEIKIYDGAPHSFFDRKADEFRSESDDAWQRVLSFVRSSTPAP